MSKIRQVYYGKSWGEFANKYPDYNKSIFSVFLKENEEMKVIFFTNQEDLDKYLKENEI